MGWALPAQGRGRGARSALLLLPTAMLPHGGAAHWAAPAAARRQPTLLAEGSSPPGVPAPPAREPNGTLPAAAGGLHVAALQLSERLAMEVELELNPRQVPQKNKAVLAAMELLLLGLCGVDRCYLGQTVLGILKGLTFGGFLVWFIIDWLTVVITNLTWSTDIHVVSFRSEFDSGIGGAFWLTLCCITLTMVILGGKFVFGDNSQEKASHDDFSIFDQDGSGYITKPAMKRILLENDVIISEEEVNALFKELDPQNSGKIHLSVLRKVMAR
mmetsp:Transcript_63910/g.197865  ORF Transcript_63910/g.197865 Transcript_63910/m.197865 type:complete len:272 (-) Transcript_63910:49-864(-)